MATEVGSGLGRGSGRTINPTNQMSAGGGIGTANTNSWGFQQLTVGGHASVRTTCRKSGSTGDGYPNHEEKDRV